MIISEEEKNRIRKLHREHTIVKEQAPLYTCPECGAEFELPEDLADHLADEHLSAGTGGGEYPDQDDAFIDTEEGGTGGHSGGGGVKTHVGKHTPR